MTSDVSSTVASDELVTSHLPLVDHIVRQVSVRFPRHVDRDELRGAGAAGLVDAARRYDPASGVPFSRYAAIRIRGEVIDAARSRDWATRRLRRDLREIDIAANHLTEHLQREPSDEEIAARTGMSAEEVQQRRAAQLTVTLLTLDRPVGAIDGTNLPLGETVAEDDTAWLPESAVEQRELTRTLQQAIAVLPVDLRAVLVAYQFEGRTLRDIADELGLTEARASQLRHEALHALQAYFSTAFDEVPPVPEEAPGKRRRQAYVAQMRAQQSLSQAHNSPERGVAEVVAGRGH